MLNKYISEEMGLVIKKIANEYPDVVFCGSLGLVLNDKLDREVKDIDILVKKNYYQKGKFYNNIRIGSESDSHKFMVGKDEVLSFKLEFPIFDKKIKVDVLYNKNVKPQFELIFFDDVRICVEKPEAAINAKIKYIEHDISHDSILKHLKDLIYLEVDKNVIIKSIDNSHLMVSKTKDNCDDDIDFLF